MVSIRRIVRIGLGTLREPVTLAAAVVRYVILNWPDTPFGELLRRRYMALRVASLGRNFRMQKGCDIGGYHLIRIGDDSGFGQNVVLNLGPGPNEFRMGSHSCGCSGRSFPNSSAHPWNRDARDLCTSPKPSRSH